MRPLMALAAVALASATASAQARPVTVDSGELAQLRHDAQTARDVEEIQNLMSRRAMLHSIGHNEEELELWSKQRVIRWAQNGGCWIGDDFRKYYVTVNFLMQKAALHAISQKNPAVADDYAQNRYIGSSVFHILSTPIIEVAADGQTAKGFWYTPGAILSSADGLTGQGVNMWERYGGDFIRENGQWRILHLEVITDFAYPFGGNLDSPMPGAPPKLDQSKSGSESARPSPGPGAEGIDVPPPTVVKQMGESYSPTRVPRLTPRLPEPYSRLGDTFEYADCRAPENPDMRPVFEAISARHDGTATRAEWLAAGLPMSSFNMFEKGRGFVTAEDYEIHAAPPGIDANGDGKVTVAEFRAFDRAMAAKRPAGGGPPPAQ